MSKVLIVDDEPQIRDLVANIVRRVDPDAEIECAASAAAAFIIDESGWDPNLVITDIDMGSKGEGFEVIELYHNRPVPAKIIAMSGSGAAVEAMRRGADVYLQKPFHLEQMMTNVRALLDNPS